MYLWIGRFIKGQAMMGYVRDVLFRASVFLVIILLGVFSQCTIDELNDGVWELFQGCVFILCMTFPMDNK